MKDYIFYLAELRSRVIKVTLCILLFFLIFYKFNDKLYLFVAKPLLESLPVNGSLIAINVTSPFMVPLKLALISSVFISIPFVLYQAWIFIGPALYQKEKRALIFPIVIGSLLFYLGVIFSYTIVCPLALKFFAKSAPESIRVMTDISNYLDFVLGLSMASGIAFQTPIITYYIIKLNIVEHKLLENFRPYIIVGSFVAGMLLTPPDVVSQIMLAIPIWMFFEVGLILAKRSIKSSI